MKDFLEFRAIALAGGSYYRINEMEFATFISKG
jgi:hypothetical protein